MSLGGIENLGVREYEQGVYISMKAGETSLQHSIPFKLEQLIPFIKEGTGRVIYCSECLSQNEFRTANKNIGYC